MACDLAVIVDGAFIRHVGLEHGSVPAGGATQWLQLMVGDRRAREIVFLCEEIPAARAAEWGLVNRAVPEADLDPTVDEWVDKLAAKLPLTTRYAKQQLNVWRDLAWHQTIGHARDWLGSVLSVSSAAASALCAAPTSIFSAGSETILKRSSGCVWLSQYVAFGCATFIFHGPERYAWSALPKKK